MRKICILRPYHSIGTETRLIVVNKVNCEVLSGQEAPRHSRLLKFKQPCRVDGLYTEDLHSPLIHCRCLAKGSCQASTLIPHSSLHLKPDILRSVSLGREHATPLVRLGSYARDPILRRTAHPYEDYVQTPL